MISHPQKTIKTITIKKQPTSDQQMPQFTAKEMNIIIFFLRPNQLIYTFNIMQKESKKKKAPYLKTQLCSDLSPS